jgi:hypothetical protein
MEEFLTELKSLFVKLEGTYEGNQPQVLQKVDEARQLLSGDGDLGEWENELLEMAERSGKADFLCLAVQNIIKAIEVSQSPQDEYDRGFNDGS